MATEPHIEVKNISKRFKRNMTSFTSILGYILGLPSPDNFWAIDDVSFNLKPGDSLGIIGANGAGKSTLLKMLSNITVPTKGTIKKSGRVGALIEVGAGFHPELTGSENIFLYGAILGMSKREIREKYEDIVEFSGLRSLINTPVKFYSSGMFLRLGFAVTAHLDPDIFIVDEAMAVGDTAFQAQCLKKMEDFKSEGKIIIVVSHDLQLIKNYTTSCMYLSQGKIAVSGTPQECIAAYRAVMDDAAAAKTTLL